MKKVDNHKLKNVAGGWSLSKWFGSYKLQDDTSDPALQTTSTQANTTDDQYSAMKSLITKVKSCF